MPELAWQPKAIFPDLKGVTRIGVDCETFDPKLMERGPGYVRRDGMVCGISICYVLPGSPLEFFKAYYPIAHDGGGNLDRGQVINYLRDQFRHPHEYVGANIMYDMGWLATLGIHMNGRKRDVLIAEPLINENKYSYNLDSVAETWLKHGKVWGKLKEGGIKYGVKKEKDLRKELWKFHSQYVGEYAEGDAHLPLQILALQENVMLEQELWDVWNLESDLLDLLLEMKFKGVRVDVERAKLAVKDLQSREHEAQVEANKFTGSILDVWSNLSIAEACNKLGVAYTNTDKGNPTFTAEWLDAKAAEVPLFALIHKVRKYNRAATYVQNSIVDMEVNGRVHCDFLSVRGEEGGTGSGRFSAVKPNLQQVPSRDPELGPLIRGLFIPEEGHEWVKFDYSQQEPRLTVHYAYERKFRGAEIAVKQYTENPDTDYHQFVADLCQIPRRPAKDINLGLAYGMGIGKMSEKLGKSKEETKELFGKYHENVPFVKALSDECMRIASIRGYVKTILGRRRHFDFWVKGYGSKPLLYDAAVKAYGLPLKRMGTHKALNSIIQGGCGDMMKSAMLECYNRGLPIPHLTVHDELDFSLLPTDDDTREEIKKVMEEIFELHIPLKVDVERGTDWGHLKKEK
jgi:DNA polymerase I-like protein with 3'-5' exonuclease and polymerase domains